MGGAAFPFSPPIPAPGSNDSSLITSIHLYHARPLRVEVPWLCRVTLEGDRLRRNPLRCIHGSSTLYRGQAETDR